MAADSGNRRPRTVAPTPAAPRCAGRQADSRRARSGTVQVGNPDRVWDSAPDGWVDDPAPAIAAAARAMADSLGAARSRPSGQRGQRHRVHPRSRRRSWVVGLVLVIVGTVLALIATLVHLAHALPLAELPAEPRALPAMLCTAVGLGLMVVGPRSWTGRPRRRLAAGAAGRRSRVGARSRVR